MNLSPEFGARNAVWERFRRSGRITTTENVEHHIAEGHTDHDETMDGVLLLEPGAMGKLIVTFHEVREFDVIACLFPGHYESGLHAELTVSE